MLEAFKDLMVDSAIVCDGAIILIGFVVIALFFMTKDSDHDLWD